MDWLAALATVVVNIAIVVASATNPPPSGPTSRRPQAPIVAPITGQQSHAVPGRLLVHYRSDVTSDAADRLERSVGVH